MAEPRSSQRPKPPSASARLSRLSRCAWRQARGVRPTPALKTRVKCGSSQNPQLSAISLIPSVVDRSIQSALLQEVKRALEQTYPQASTPVHVL